MEKEKKSGASKTLQFKVFCFEAYKNEQQISGKQAQEIFKAYGVFKYIGQVYNVLHSMGEKYIVEDIKEFIKARTISD